MRYCFQEEEEVQRLEALKKERKKRIAARSGSNVVQSPATPKQPQPRLPLKVSTSSYKSSKFTDSEPGLNSRLQKLPVKSSLESNDSDKTTKPPRSNGLSRSESSLPEFKRERAKQVGSSASERIRRLSEPKVSSAHSVPPKSTNTVQVNKISAIIQLDRTKSETLPELKIKSYKTAPEAVKNKPAIKQQKGAGSRTSVISESSHFDDNPVIEKTVVMLENEVVPSLPVQTCEAKIDSVDLSYRDVKQAMVGIDIVYSGIQALPSPIYGVKSENPTEGNQNDQLNSYEVKL